MRFKLNKNTIQHLFLFGWVLFSLAPCSTKDSLLSLFEISHNKPLNKTVSNSTIVSCQLLITDSKTSINKEKLEFGSYSLANFIVFEGIFELRNEELIQKHTGSNSNAPPIYIYLKRLRIPLV